MKTMALPSVVSPSASSSSPIDPNIPLVSVQDSPGRFFDGMLFSNPDFASPMSIASTPAPTATTIFVDTNSNNGSNHAHSCSLSSHSIHSDGQLDNCNMPSCRSASAYGAKVDQSPQQYYEFDISSTQLEQHPGTSSSQQQPQTQPSSSLLLPTSPATSPQSSLELSSIQQSLEKNRESLKHKLSHRASIRELVCRGIYPSPRIPIGHVEQRRKLERAKTGDLLRHHIQSRPDREFLIGHNILHADGRIDFRIAARQKELKKCRLAENLNQHLVTRPGPLDLVDRNILEAPQQLHIALRAGLLPISSTKVESTPEVSLTGDPGQAGPYFASVDASNMSSPAAFVFDPVITPGTTVVHAAPATTTTAIPMILSNQRLVYTPLSTITGVVTSNAPSCDYLILQSEQQPQGSTDLGSFSAVSVAAAPSSVGSTAARKGATNNFKQTKSQTGSQKTKTQILKFHEYKGPPDVVKSSKQQSNNGSDSQQPAALSHRFPSTSDSAARQHLEALVNQQALYLKYQKYSTGNGSPPAASSTGSVTQSNYQTSSTSSAISLSLSPGSSTSSSNASSSIPPVRNSSLTSSIVSSQQSAASTSADNSSSSIVVLDRIVTRQTLSDLRVAELKSYCRQLGLPTSGTKQTLVDRLDARLDASRQHNNGFSQQTLPNAPSHSSSALFFTDSNGIVAPLNGNNNLPPGKHLGPKPETRSEEIDEVITISSSASSPGIVHDNESSANNNNNGTVSTSQTSSFGWYGNQTVQQNLDASNEQLWQLHNRVESQQRHIEQLKAELQFERRKRLDENSTEVSIAGDDEQTIVVNTPCDISNNASMSLDAWQDGPLMSNNSNGPRDNLLPVAQTECLPPTVSGLEPAQNSAGVGELDDIMDLIGSFPDQNGTGPSSFMINEDILKSPSPREPNTNNTGWHLSDFGLNHCDINSSNSPMSPWLFDNDNLHFPGVNNSGTLATNGNSFLSQSPYGQQNGETGGGLIHTNGSMMLPVNDEFFTLQTNTVLSRANFT